MIETVVLLQPIGAECPDDIGLLADDGCLGSYARSSKVVRLADVTGL